MQIEAKGQSWDWGPEPGTGFNKHKYQLLSWQMFYAPKCQNISKLCLTKQITLCFKGMPNSVDLRTMIFLHRNLEGIFRSRWSLWCSAN